MEMSNDIRLRQKHGFNLSGMQRAKSMNAMHFIEDFEMDDFEEDNTHSCSCAMCLWEVNDDGMNMKLFEEKKLLADQLANSHQKEEAVIERLVDCQMRLDEMQADRDADRHRINELLEVNADLEAENMQLDRDLSRSGGARHRAPTGGGYTGLARVGGGAKQPPAELFRRIKELELVIENLRTELMEAHKEADRKEERWKFVEIQKEKLAVRRELHQVRAELDWTRRRAAGAEQRLTKQVGAREAAESALLQLKKNFKGDPHLSSQLQEFTSQVVRLRRRCCKIATQQQQGQGQGQGQGHHHISTTGNLGEMRAVCKSVQDLSDNVNRLSMRNTSMGSCENLDDSNSNSAKQYDNRNRIIRNHQYYNNTEPAPAPAPTPTSSSNRRYEHDPMEVMRQKNLQLEIENKKLRKS